MRDMRWEVTGFGAYPQRFTQAIELIRAMNRPVKIIAGACHNGAEPFTMAMHLIYAGISDVKVIAHDGHAEHHKAAMRGQYLKSEIDVDFKMERLPEHFREYFVPVDDDKRLGIREDVRGLIQFTPGPVLLPGEGIESADVFAIRNLWHHIQPRNRIFLVGKLRDALPADGVILTRTVHWNEIAETAPKLGTHIYGRPFSDAEQRLARLTLAPAFDPLYAERHAGQGSAP
ncbi:CheR family methyltransferase [Nocardia sp. NPDC049220]|uniref:CheR family methyltransferase n=1 Tax=Nocardia sp. NPDC049220 TaxID=3155273 RepID=UPI0033DA9637